MLSRAKSPYRPPDFLLEFFIRMKKIPRYLFFAILVLPYFIHASQDLPSSDYGINHDEAATHLNAKDLVMFGRDSLENNRLKFVTYPLHTSLCSMRVKLAFDRPVNVA